MQYDMVAYIAALNEQNIDCLIWKQLCAPMGCDLACMDKGEIGLQWLH